MGDLLTDEQISQKSLEAAKAWRDDKDTSSDPYMMVYYIAKAIAQAQLDHSKSLNVFREETMNGLLLKDKQIAAALDEVAELWHRGVNYEPTAEDRALCQAQLDHCKPIIEERAKREQDAKWIEWLGEHRIHVPTVREVQMHFTGLGWSTAENIHKWLMRLAEEKLEALRREEQP